MQRIVSGVNQKIIERIQAFSNKALLTLIPVALAQGPADPGFKTPPSNIDTAGEVVGAVGRASQFLFALFMALAVIFILVAALFYLTAAGNQTQVDKAKHVLVYSIVAVVIALIAGGLVPFIGNILNVNL